MKRWLPIILALSVVIVVGWFVYDTIELQQSSHNFFALEDQEIELVNVLGDKLDEDAYSQYNDCILNTEAEEGYLFYCLYGDDYMGADWFIERSGQEGEKVKATYQEYVETIDGLRWKEYKTIVYDEDIMSQFTNQAQSLHSIGVMGRDCNDEEMLVIKDTPVQADSVLYEKLDQYNELKEKGYSVMDFCVESTWTGLLLFDASQKVSSLLKLDVHYDQIYPYENDIVVAVLNHDELTYAEIEVDEMCFDCPGEPFCQADSTYKDQILFICSIANDAGTLSTWYAYDFEESKLIKVKQSTALWDYGVTKGGEYLTNVQIEVFDQSLLDEFNHQKETYE